MRLQLQVIVALCLFVPIPAASQNVCVEFLTEHLTEEDWEKACVEWLNEHAEANAPAIPLASQAGGGSASASSSSLSFTINPAVHVSASDLALADENQVEVFIAVDEVDAAFGRAFILSNQSPFAADGMFGASAEATMTGIDWTPRAVGEQGQTILPAAFFDPWAVFTQEGVLYISYLLDGPRLDPVAFPTITPGTRPTIIAMSTDGGVNFEFKEALGGTPLVPATDRGSMATGRSTVGSGSLWVNLDDGGGGPIVIRGAELDGQGELVACGAGPTYFCSEQVIADSAVVAGPYRPGQIAVGPSGEVLATFFRTLGVGNSGTTEIFFAVDSDGLASGDSFPAAGDFCPEPTQAQPPGCIEPLMTTNVGFGENLPPTRSISALANLAWHRASGRVYMVTTVEEPNGSGDTDVVILWSDDRLLQNPPPGGPWTDPASPLTVNDDLVPPMGVRSQFFPHVSVDQTTGAVAVAWHDARADDGSGGTNDQRDTDLNTEPEVFLRVGVPTPTGIDFAPSFAISDGSSDDTSNTTTFGDYLGVGFHDGQVWTSWADNSNSAGDNPADEGCPTGPDPLNPRPCMDAYVSVVEVMPEPQGFAQQAAGLAALVALAARRRARRVQGRHLFRTKRTATFPHLRILESLIPQ